MRKIVLSLIIAQLLTLTCVSGQVLINEGANANATQILDEDNDDPDWIELYNAGSTAVSLQGYGLSDKVDVPSKWTFPQVMLPAGGYQLVFLSGKDRKPQVDHYETALFAETSWKYLIPTTQPPSTWNLPSFATGNWLSGKCSIGYGDGDDSTQIAGPATSIYIRRNFTISDTSALENALLHMDYDDGFVAYLNGVEVARAGLTGVPPMWDELAVDHEASVYQGGNYELFTVNHALLQSAMVNGQNTFAIELHNYDPNSSDLTVRPYLSFGINNSNTYFSNPPTWFFTGSANSNFHTNFSISGSGETIWLRTPAGGLADTLLVRNVGADISIGRQTDGGPSKVFFATATPNSTNNTAVGYNGRENAPIIQLAGGFYPNTQTVAIINTSATANPIYYTLDGEVPTTADNLYTAPIAISKTATLRARCIPAATLLPSYVATETYFIQDSSTLPIVSVTMDSVDLYGANGIYDNYYTDWKKPCYYEYFDKNGVKICTKRASIKIDGGAGGSRTHPQRSFTIEPAHELYGDGQWEYPLMKDKPYHQKWDEFYMRNGSNFWLTMPYREAFLQRIMRNTDVGYSGYTPALLYLNGEYWGVYEIREKTNLNYYEENLGATRDNQDILSVSYFYGPGIIRTLKGSDTSFYSMHDFITTQNPSSATYYEDADKRLDLHNFTDYLIAELWMGNGDWLFNNMKMARNSGSDFRWRFNLQDLENSLGYWSNVNDNMFDFLHTAHQPNPYVEIYEALVQNTQFKHYFVNRYADIMNTRFLIDSLTQVCETMHNEIRPEMPREYIRWTDTLATSVAQSMDGFDGNKNYSLDQMAQRSQFVRDHIVSEFTLVKPVLVTLNASPTIGGHIKISTIIPMNLPWSGYYFDGVPVRLTAIPSSGYTFVTWVQNGLIAPADLTNPSLILNIPNNTTFIAVFTGVPTVPSLTISEINYNCDSTLNGGNWVELHNFDNEPLDISDWHIQTNKYYEDYVIPTGTVIAANGYYVIAEDTALFAALYPNVQNVLGGMGFGFSNSGDSIKVRNKFGKPICTAFYTDSLPFPVCADGWGRTLELTQNTAILTDPTSWFCGCMRGSPGTAYSPCEDPLIISEINYNNLPTADAGDWVEVKNNGNQSLSLSNWQLKDKENDHIFTLPAQTLLPGERWVLYQNQAKFVGQHSSVANASGAFVFGLGNSGDVLRLYDDVGVLRFSMVYDDIAPWTIKPDTGGYTLEYIDTLGYKNPNDATSWFAGCKKGSPGTSYTPCFVSDISQPLVEGEIQLFPNPTEDAFYLKFLPTTTEKYALTLWDIQGRKLQTLWEGMLTSTPFVQNFSLKDIEPGVYFIKIQTPRGAQSVKIMKAQ